MTIVREWLAYRDPETVIATLERGDAEPVRQSMHAECLGCAHWRNPLDGWPCAIDCMPSPTTGRCAKWEDG